MSLFAESQTVSASCSFLTRQSYLPGRPRAVSTQKPQSGLKERVLWLWNRLRALGNRLESHKMTKEESARTCIGLRGFSYCLVELSAAAISYSFFLFYWNNGFGKHCSAALCCRNTNGPKTQPLRQDLAFLCVRGQMQQVMDALQRPEVKQFASQPLDAAGDGRGPRKSGNRDL